MKKSNQSLVSKFIFITGAALFAVLLLITIISVNFAINSQNKLSLEYNKSINSIFDSQKKSAKMMIHSSGESIAMLLTKSASDLMMNFDYESLASVAQNAVEDKSVSFVAFFDESGALLAGEKLEQADHVLSYDLIADDVMIGKLEMGLDFQELETNMATLAAENDALSAHIKKTIITAKNNMTMTLGAVSLAGIVILSLIIYVVLVKIIIKPINSTVAMLQDIAEGDGDLTKRLVVQTNDEIGKLSGYFNTFIEKLQGIITEIAKDAESLHLSASDLKGLSGSLSTGSDDMTSKSSAVSVATDGMNTNISAVAAAMEEASANIKSMVAAIEEMSTNIANISQSVTEAKNRSQQAVSKAETTSTLVHELGQSADEISTVTDTIAAISDKTNLLALNATIEAARAGEAGKGFAVVANEIKGLAQQTAEATGSIAKKLKNIQESSRSTVSGIEEISEVIAEVDTIVSTISDAIDQQNQGTAEISENISQTSNGLNEVVENVNQSSESVSQIAHDISEVNEIAGTVSNTGAQLSESSITLGELANQIQKLVGTFQVK